MPRLSPRIIVQKGGVAGGRMECDSVDHFWIFGEHQQYGLREKSPCGKCRDFEACKRQAALLAKQEQEEAEMKAKAASASKPAAASAPAMPAINQAKKG